MKQKKFKKNLKKIAKAIKNAQIGIDDLYEYLFELRIDFRKEIRDLFPVTQEINIENGAENENIEKIPENQTTD